MKVIHIAQFAFIALTVLVGCGKGAWLTPTSLTDTPEHNYNNGIRALESGNYEDAMASFERARGLDPKYAPAYEGIGLVHLAQNRLEDAEKSFKESIKKDGKYAPAYIGQGRVYLAQGKYGKARGRFDRAMEVEPQNVDAHYYKGTSYMAENEFKDARKWFRKALDLDNSYEAADREWAKADKIERAMPGTELGQKIALQDQLTRADLSALLVEELKLDKVFRRTLRKTEAAEISPAPQNPPTLTDVDENWAEGYIRPLVQLGVLMPYPDNTFRPNAPVQRRDFAIAVQNVLTAVLGEEALRTAFVGDATAFPDVQSSHFAYNAVLLVTTRGILTADVETGNFNPLDPISGADALIGLRKLASLFP